VDGNNVLLSELQTKKHNFKPALWIRYIFVQLRIRGSVPLTYGSGFGSRSFRQRISRCQPKVKFFCLLLVEGTRTFHQSSMKKSHKEDTKQLKTIVFVTFFCLTMDGCGFRIRTNNDGSGSTTLLRTNPGRIRFGLG
jgi:hypothetical protein